MEGFLDLEGESAGQVEDLYGPELTACWEQLKYAGDRSHDWSGRVPPTPPKGTISADHIIMLEYGRATKSYWASVRLASLGFAEQSMMVNRSLFEGMVVAHWVSDNQDLAESRFVDALRYADHETAELAQELGWWSQGEAKAHSLPIEEAEALRKQYGWGLWTNPKGMDKLIDEVEHLWLTEESRREFREFYRAAYSLANKTLHADAFGLAGALRSFTDEVFSVTAGPEPKDVNKALYMAFRTYSELFSLVSEHFEFDVEDEFPDLYRGWLGAFYRLKPDLAKGRDRNSTCPCGSGRKIKQCHGR